MYENESRIDRVKRFSKIWWKSRADAGKSQEFMALGIGVSKKTIQNWEKGLSSPNFFQATEWFHLLGINPRKYFLEFLYPNLFSDRNSNNEIKLDEILINIIKNFSIAEKEQLIHIMTGNHGSSWLALLQLFLIYCQISFQARATIARSILENYEIEKATGQLVNPNESKIDLDLLDSAILQCKTTAKNKDSGYSTLFFEKNNNDFFKSKK